MNRYIFTILIVLIAAAFAPAARAVVEKPEYPSIVTSITEDEDAGNTIEQPAGLAERVDYHEVKDEPPKRKVDSRAGFRVQIYSDGNPRTARSNARARLRTVASRFPQYRTYTFYQSPYWRARVGDFKTREEANKAAAAIRAAFPSFSKEVRVVPDRISILETK